MTAERDALAKAHAQCEALYAALAAQYGLKASAHGAAQPLLAGGYSRVHTGVLTGTPRQAGCINTDICVYICLYRYIFIYVYMQVYTYM